MDIELDADIESLESLISDEINNSNNDDCSENSFDAELNLLASTLKENDMQNEPNNETEEKCDAQGNLKSGIEPNNHITDENSKKSIKLSPLKESHKTNVKSISEVDVDGRECHKEFHGTDNCCDFNKSSSELGASVINEQSTDLKCRSDLEKHGKSDAADKSHFNVPLKREMGKYDETGNSIGNSENLEEECVKCIERMEEEIMKENGFENSVTDKYNTSSVDENETKCEIHCSTPIVKEVAIKKIIADHDRISSFGLLSPLTTYSSAVGGSCHLKRKLCIDALPAIKEEEEESDVPSKKTKCDTEDSCVAKNSKSPMKTIEPPAMAILKKWRPKCLSSSSSFYLLDESGVSDAQSNQSGKEDDDFEIAMKSLSEELIRQSNSDDLKALDLYHNHVLAENEEDGLKFEEVLQQMTNELEGMSEFIGLDERGESAYNDDDDDVEKNEITVIEIDCQKDLSSALTENAQKSNDSTLVNEQSAENSPCAREDKITTANEAVKDDNAVTKENGKPVQNHNEELSPNNIECITLTDEEDVLLEDEPEILLESDTNQNKKPREMVEFISKDPKENEDNFNPEWELLRKLNTDEERYKAVRQRWRSLVIPDPKRDLTFRQWRRRNNLPSSNHLKGNPKASKQQIRKYVGNQLCTALFDQNIEGILRQKEEKRLALHKKLQSKIMRLGHIQNQEQQKLYALGGSYQEFSHLYLRHMEELRRLQGEYQKRLENEELASFEKIDALKKASAEVLAFEKFYQGLDNDKKDNAVFLSDIEIQELMETEIMLEQYDKYYV